MRFGPSFCGVLVCAVAASGAEPPREFPLWTDAPPGEVSVSEPDQVTVSGDPPEMRVTRVHRPTLTAFPAPAEKANGCGVIVCPGGGYNLLAFDKEGTEVARWLNSLGVTAFVLKYRVPRRDPQQPHAAPLQDVQRAIRLVRGDAQRWGLDRRRLGVLGFSAGGHLAVLAGTHWDRRSYEPSTAADQVDCRPDFVIPIYPAYLGDEEHAERLSPLIRVNSRTPPMFIAVTYDDQDRAIGAARLLIRLKQADVAAELHVYSRGGHGYGLRPSANPVSTWPQRCEDWLRASGWLTAGS